MLEIDLLNSLRPKIRKSYQDWCKANLILGDGSCKGQLIKPSAWQSLIMPLMDKYKSIIINAVPQSGKTTLLTGWLLWRLEEYGDDCLLAAPNQIITHRYYKDKFEKSILLNPAIKQLLPSNYNSKSTTQKELYLNNNASIKFDYNPDNIRGYSSKIIGVTEAGSFDSVTSEEADTITLAMQRTASYGQDARYCIESTPTVSDSKHWSLMQAGTNTTLQIACPICGQLFQPGKRSNLKGWQDAHDVADIQPVVVCPHCEFAIQDADRNQYQPVLVHANPNADSLSVTIDWWWTPRTMKEVAALEWQMKKEPSLDTYRNLMQNCYGEAINPEVEAEAIQEDIGTTARFSHSHMMARRGNYSIPQTPAGIDSITVGMDIGLQYGYYIVLGHNSSSNSYYVLNYGSFEFVPSAEQATRPLPTTQEVYKTLDDLYANLMELYRPSSFAVDINYQLPISFSNIVVEWAKTKLDIICCRGAGVERYNQSFKNQFKMPPQLVDYVKVVRDSKAGCNTHYIAVDKIKEELNQLIQTHDKWYFPRDIIKPDGQKAHIFRHFLKEKRSEARFGFTVRYIWQNLSKYEKPTTGGNHEWDACVYAFAASLMTQYKYTGTTSTCAPIITPATEPMIEQPQPAQQAPQQVQPNNVLSNAQKWGALLNNNKFRRR